MKGLAAWAALVSMLGALAVGTSFSHAARQVTCSGAKAAVAAKLRSIPAARKRYFRTHRRAADRKRFVAKQQRDLKRLRAVAAGACRKVSPCPPALRTNGNTFYEDASIRGERLAANADGSYSVRVTKKS